MPTTSSTGHLHLDYTSHPPPIWHHSLALFRPSMFPIGVIGITSCTSSTSLQSVQVDFVRKIKHLYPYNSPYPLARSCFAFEGSTDGLQLAAEEAGVEVIPSVLGNKTSGHIGMLLAGFCSQILTSFSSMASRDRIFVALLTSYRAGLWIHQEGGRFCTLPCSQSLQ